MKFFIAKSTLLVAAFFSVSVISHAQYVPDSVINEPTGELLDTTGSARLINKKPVEPSGYNTRYYKWDTPFFEIVDIDGIYQYRNDNVRYLSELETLENVLGRNRKELKKYRIQAKDLMSALNNDKKNLNEKRNFYKEDEKLLKREKKLRDDERKLIQRERKELGKSSNGLSDWQVEERLAKFKEREERLDYAERRWESKREVLRQNTVKLSETQSVINDKGLEIKERSRELDTYQRQLDLQQKQLSLEKKQAKLEIKKAKAAIKEQENKKVG